MEKEKGTLTSVRNKFLRKAGYSVKSTNPKYNEQEVNARVLAPICALDIAYGAFQTLPKEYFKRESKRWYNEARDKFRRVFGRAGILYNNLNENELMAVNDYMEKQATECAHDIEILKWQIRGHLMDFPTEKRETAATLILIMTILCYSHDMLLRDLNTDFEELFFIARRTDFIFDWMRKEVFGKQMPSVGFADKQFELTLTILFKHLNGVSTEGIC